MRVSDQLSRLQGVLEQLNRVQGVLDLMCSIADEHDVGVLCARVFDACFRLLGAERAALVLYDPDTTNVCFKIARDRDGRPFELASCALGGRMEFGESAVDTVVEDEGRLAGVARSTLAAPLRYHTTEGEWHGMLLLDADAAVRAFSRPDLELLESMCTPIGLALKNTALFHRMQSVIGDEWRRLERVVRDLPLGVVVLDDRRRCVLVNRWVTERATELGAIQAGIVVDAIADIPCSDLIGSDLRTTTTTDSDRIVSLTSNTLTDGRETVIVIADITDERERSTQAAHRERVALVGQLAGGVAHDFNNLLHVILTYSTMLEDSLQDPDQRDDAHQITHAATSAAELTRQLLTFSRRELVKPKVVDVPHVVHAMEKLLRRTCGPRIDLVLSVGSRVPRILIDQSQLEAILMNLVVNARDAMLGEGAVAVAIRDVVIDPITAEQRNIAPGDYCGIDVTDSGSGIPPELIERIFEPYFTTKPRGHGTGLGLATVHGIVQQAHGDIAVESQLNHGTTFRILLPATNQPSEQRMVVASTASAATILVVDDDDNVRRATERILRSAGYSVLSASSGHNAIAFAREHAGAIDLLLTDVVMPGMSGNDLAREILALRATERVVFMSGYHQHGPIREQQFISKPFQRVDLLEKVRTALATAPAA